MPGTTPESQQDMGQQGTLSVPEADRVTLSSSAGATVGCNNDDGSVHTEDAAELHRASSAGLDESSGPLDDVLIKGHRHSRTLTPEDVDVAAGSEHFGAGTEEQRPRSAKPRSSRTGDLGLFSTRGDGKGHRRGFTATTEELAALSEGAAGPDNAAQPKP